MPSAAKTVPLSNVIPRNRSKDITCYLYFQGAISRGLWRFILYRFTPSTVWFLVLTLLFLSYGTNSLEIQAYTPVCYLLCIWLLTFVVSRITRPRIQVRARYSDRVSVGEILPVDLDVLQQRRWRQELNVIPHRLPPPLDPIPEDGVRVPAVAKGGSARVSLGLLCRERGLHVWHGFRAENDFPFGLYRSYRTIVGHHAVLVTPDFSPLRHVDVPAGRRYQPGGIAMASHLGDSFEFIGNREYREGDNIRDMDWRATARLNRPIVREYREEYFLRVAVVLDTYVPKRSTVRDHEDFERAVSLTAAIGDYMARSDYIVDLFAAGPQLYRLTAGRSLAYLDQILEILACVEENPSEPFATLEPEITESLAQITSVVCIFLDWNERRRKFAQRLLESGAGLKIIIVRDAPCALDPYADGLASPVIVIDSQTFAAGLEEL